ncbi:hypothetical protein Tco_0644125 [Tanacetum coccineum]
MTPRQEAKDLATLHLDELIENLKVYEMVLDNNGVRSKTTKEKVTSARVYRSDKMKGTKIKICNGGIDSLKAELKLYGGTKVVKARHKKELATIAG